MAAPSADGADLGTLARVADQVRANIERVIEGKPDVVQATLVVLLAEGHLLIEDVPGVGKTMLSKALARSIAPPRRPVAGPARAAAGLQGRGRRTTPRPRTLR